MKRHWKRILPFATDSAGAIGAFANCRAHALPLDPSGTSATYWRNDSRESDNFFSSRIPLSTSHFTLGHDEDFMAAYRRELDAWDCDMIVLVDTPISAQVGVDLEGLGVLLEEEYQRPVIAVRTTANKFYDIGVADALVKMYDRVIPRAERKQLKDQPTPGTVGLVGASLLDYGNVDHVASLEGAIESSGASIVARWGSQSTLDELAEGAHAERNIVASVAGMKLAKKMERELGIPFATLGETELFDHLTEELSIDFDSRILVVGEQVTSNLLRRLLGIMARNGSSKAEIDVATFFTLDKSIALEGDTKFEDEDGLEKLVKERGYNLVIIDPFLETIMPKGSRHLVHPLAHNATSNHAFTFDYPANPLDPEWLADAAEIINREQRTSFMPVTASNFAGARGTRKPPMRGETREEAEKRQMQQMRMMGF